MAKRTTLYAAFDGDGTWFTGASVSEALAKAAARIRGERGRAA